MVINSLFIHKLLTLGELIFKCAKAIFILMKKWTETE